MSKREGVRNALSHCAIELHMYCGETLVSTASGFLYEWEGQEFLITNWHVVSGKSFLTGDLIGTAPNRMKTKITTELESVNGQRSFACMSKEIDIYSNEKPVWLEHNTLGSSCDVVAIPVGHLNINADLNHRFVNSVSDTEIPIEPGCLLFVIGFPNTISVGPGFPIWKSGYLASEPNFEVRVSGQVSDVGGLQAGVSLPAYFIDALTREGMSGSPVFACYTGVWDSRDPYEPLKGFEDVNIGKAFHFLGCYSARIGSKEDRAALGLIWNEKAIVGVCEGKIGKHPHIL